MNHADKVSPIPEGYRTITPYLIIDGAAKAIDFYKKAFGAKVVMRMDSPNGKVGHAELIFGDSKIMLGDECPEMEAFSPKKHNGSPVGIHLYVEDVDATVKRAVEAGAKITREVEDQFYGDRTGSLEDPFGHSWYVATHIEDVSEEETKRRAAELFNKK
jgi:PhnB protein